VEKCHYKNTGSIRINIFRYIFQVETTSGGVRIKRRREGDRPEIRTVKLSSPAHNSDYLYPQ
jgi:hypothetical protein